MDTRQQRAAAAEAQPDMIPAGAGRLQPFGAQLRAEKVDHDGQQKVRLTGYASVAERGYPMWDAFGEYTEIVDRTAFDQTLEASPDVAFLVNHKGVTMARTSNGTLTLSADERGLMSEALLNPKRQDVTDLVLAIEDGDITEMSFAFTIDEGEWSEDFETFRIKRVNLDRGDVSAVNYGANPYTNIAARSGELLRELQQLPAGAARAAMQRLSEREDVAPKPTGPSVALLRARLSLDED